MKAKIRGTEIYFDIAGMQLIPKKEKLINKPVLFLLHGGPGSDHLRYKQHSLELQEAAQLVFIDFRGCGRSKKTKPADYTMENNIEDIEALRKHLGLERICILGASYGGMVAQGYAIRYAKQIEKLILVATSPSRHYDKDAKRYLKQHATPRQIAMSEHLWNGTFKNSKHLAKYFKTMEPLYTKTSKNNPKLAYAKSKTIWSIEALNQFCKTESKSFNYVPKLKKITCPTLILAGNDDWVCRPTGSKEIAKHIPHAKLKIFKNCGHAIAVDAHDQYIKLIKQFISK